MCVPDAVKGPPVRVTKSIDQARRIRTPYVVTTATRSSHSGSGAGAFRSFPT